MWQAAIVGLEKKNVSVEFIILRYYTDITVYLSNIVGYSNAVAFSTH